MGKNYGENYKLNSKLLNFVINQVNTAKYVFLININILNWTSKILTNKYKPKISANFSK